MARTECDHGVLAFILFNLGFLALLFTDIFYELFPAISTEYLADEGFVCIHFGEFLIEFSVEVLKLGDLGAEVLQEGIVLHFISKIYMMKLIKL